MAALLGKIGGREIDGDSPGGKREAGGNQGRADPLARFGHGLVGQADDAEGRQARRDLDLHVHRARIDAFKRNCGYVLDHCALAPRKA